MTRKGKIIYWVISFILAFIAVSLHIIVLYPIFFTLHVSIYHYIKLRCRKEDDNPKNENQTVEHPTDDKKEMSVYFGDPGIWDDVAKAAGANDFDIWKWWKDNRNRWFRAFHRNVLLSGGDPSVEYEKFEDFIDPRKGNGIIASKATSSSESE